MKSIIIINGPNLNLLGKREPEIYGSVSFEEYFLGLRKKYPKTILHYFQSNHEGAIIDKLHEFGFEHDGIILNAGGYSHTSIAIGDAIKGINTPVIEVHISNTLEREEFRHFSYLKKPCIQSFIGQGLNGYDMAIDYFLSV